MQFFLRVRQLGYMEVDIDALLLFPGRTTCLRRALGRSYLSLGKAGVGLGRADLCDRLHKVVIIGTEDFSDSLAYGHTTRCIEQNLRRFVHFGNHQFCIEHENTFVYKIELGP